MSKLYKTALYVHVPTQKVIYRLNCQTPHKYFWEKQKGQMLEKIIKDRFYDKGEVIIREYDGATEV